LRQRRLPPHVEQRQPAPTPSTSAVASAGPANSATVCTTEVADRAGALPEPEQAELPLSQDTHHLSAIMADHMEVDELFDAWERAWSGRDPRGFESICVPEVHYEDPLTSEPLIGTRVLGKHARKLWKALPDARVNSTGARLSDGSFVCAPCRILGTHTGPLGRIHPTGRPLEVHAVVYAELQDDKLWRVRAFFDVYAAAMSVGVLPKPGTAGERAMLVLRGFGLRG
jgi:ketosteroid isomerase-like protein